MKKKLLSLGLVVAFGAIAVVGGTLAYFTDTETANNTFTVGNVDITLEELLWDADTSDKLLMPGVEFAKDPTITNIGSEDAYVFLQMDLPEADDLLTLMWNYYEGGAELEDRDYATVAAFTTALLNDNDLRESVVNTWFSGITHSDWAIMGTETLADGTLSLVLGYQKDDAMLSENEDVTFMTAFNMPSDVTADMIPSNFYGTFNMNFTASAIQTAEIDGLDAAYAILFPAAVETE